MREKKNIAFINGKRLNYCSEIQALEFGKDSDTLKSLISGEPTEARPIYGDNFTAYNIPLLMANANQMPYLKDWSYGMRRRICIIPFEVEIPKARQKKELSRDLEAEYPAIFNWILEGRDRFIANGYRLT
jgi:phage/plasmid-associated DNA primase